VIVEGTALLVPGDDVDTDVMYPGAFLNIEDPDEMAPHLFEGYDASLRQRLGEGTILVVGANFGIGSSREHVPLAMQANGVRGVLGRSFARIFYRNCVNLALPAIACPDAADAARDGSQVRIDPSGTVEIDGVTFAAPAYAGFLLELGAAGGLVPWTARELGRASGRASRTRDSAPSRGPRPCDSSG
jgi:3-isopropylmalate/(R)-2-methylmalate dehydratase small subunit